MTICAFDQKMFNVLQITLRLLLAKSKSSILYLTKYRLPVNPYFEYTKKLQKNIVNVFSNYLGYMYVIYNS